jgi:uncharacterized membrane protein (UPF0136 family)
MLAPTKIYFIVFGLLTIAGGIMGYVKAGSNASLIAGSLSGLLLLLAAFLLPNHAPICLALGGIVSLLLIGYFCPVLSHRQNDASRNDVAPEHPWDGFCDRRLDSQIAVLCASFA